MDLVIAVIRGVADGILMLIQIAMLVRAVMSWLPGGEDNVIGNIAYTITEPVIIPVRNIMERSETIRNFPIDMSFFVTFMLISLISALFFP